MTMLDKCARAIWEKWEDAYPPSDKRPWEQADTFLDGMLTKALCYMLAQTVLEALRDPTPEMVALGEGYSDFVLDGESHDNSVEGRRAEMKMAWQVMIATALGEMDHYLRKAPAHDRG